MITLTLKEQPSVPLEAETISPDVCAPLALDQVRALPVFLGKRQLRLDDFFSVAGAGGEELELHGEAGRVKWIGRGMTRGRIRVVGNAGMHLGAYMKGGTIEVTGNAADWIGAEMRGGLIRIQGNAGGQIGAAYRGSLSGMNGGTIAVKGPVRDFAGLQMKGGTIILMSGAEIRTGAWMQRGTIVSLAPLRLLPTFGYACSYNPTFLRVYAKQLLALGFSIPHQTSEGAYRRYTGDTSVPGKGEVLGD